MKPMKKSELEYFIKGKLQEAGGKSQKDVATYALHVFQPNFSRALKNGTITYIQATQIAAYLGYDIVWIKHGEQ